MRFDVNSIKQPQFENPYQEEEEEEKEEFCWLGTLEMTALWASFGSLRKSALTLSKTSISSDLSLWLGSCHVTSLIRHVDFCATAACTKAQRTRATLTNKKPVHSHHG